MTLAMDALPEGVRYEEDGEEARWFLQLDMLHLDADALHDRLHHWTLTRLAGALPAAHAGVSFRHAHPADPHEASTLDAQESWLGLEPTLTLDLRAARPGDADRARALLDEFLRLVERTGRPHGWRSPDVGSME